MHDQQVLVQEVALAALPLLLAVVVVAAPPLLMSLRWCWTVRGVLLSVAGTVVMVVWTAGSVVLADATDGRGGTWGDGPWALATALTALVTATVIAAGPRRAPPQLLQPRRRARRGRARGR